MKKAIIFGVTGQDGAYLSNLLLKKGYKVQIIDFQEPFRPKLPTGIWSFKRYYGYNKLKKELIFYRFREKYFKSCTEVLYH